MIMYDMCNDNVLVRMCIKEMNNISGRICARK
jgi:hypothetical protein